MYLTQFAINPARRGAQKLLSSPQVMHAAVLASFPSDATGIDPAAGEARVLWRVDQTGSAARLLMSSPKKPDLTHFVEQAGWPTTHTWQTREYAVLLDRLEVGQFWGFRLKANPVHAVRVAEGQRTKPLGHVTVMRQEDWLTSRALKHGFTFPKSGEYQSAFTIQHRETIRFSRRSGTVTLTTATYEGRLEVTDATALRLALVSGIGRAKGYGCGMLTLAPLI